MADLVITAANVAPGTGASTQTGIAGAAITAGQLVYFDSASRTYKLADCNSATAAARAPSGVALDNAAIGQPITVAPSGPVTIGAALTPGLGYYLSPNPGGICPVADLVTGCFPVFLGFAISATVLNLSMVQAGLSL
jgi:hypothetical protein